MIPPSRLLRFMPGLAAIALLGLPASVRAETSLADSLVRVNSTNQNYNFLKPWAKRPPYTRRGIGVVLTGGRVIVTAELVANHTSVELERPTDSEKSPATVARIDYDANLALLTPAKPGFLDEARPATIAAKAAVGESIDVVQVESNGSVARTAGVVTTTSVLPYPADGLALLGYRISAPLQYRDASFTLPVFAADRLVGLLMRYDARSQTADLVSAPVIANFLERARREPFPGFPRAGLGFSPTRDPQFRNYLGMDSATGVYISSVIPGSPADKAGLRKGDVLLSLGGQTIDNDGNYLDPDYGRIPFSHLVSGALPGGTLPLEILRGRERKTLSLPLEPRDPETILSESTVFDRPPRFLVLGGLVFTELSRPYLKEWGGNWRTEAPSRLVYLDEFPEEWPAKSGRIVILSEVLPAENTVGYEDVANSAVRSVNGKPISRLEDLAAAVKSPKDGFHRIELDSDPGVIFLDAKRTADSAAELQRTYGLPALDNLSPPDVAGR